MATMTRQARAALLGVALCGACAKEPTAPVSLQTQGPRTGTNVGVASVFFADFAALAKAGKLTALAPLLVKAISNGSAADLLAALQLLANDGKAAPFAQALNTLLSSQDTAPLSALVGQNGPIHLLAADPQAPEAVAALAALSRTGVLRRVGYQAMDALLQSPLTGALLPVAADTLQLGGPAAFTYAAGAMGLSQLDAQGNPVPVGIAALDLMLAIHGEGRLHPLLDPLTSALGDPQLAAALRVGGAVLDHLAQSPQDLAAVNAIVDGLGPVLGTGVLNAELTSPDGVSPSALQLLLNAQILGSVQLVPTVVVPGGDASSAVQPLQASVASIPVNALDAAQKLLGPGGSVGVQLLQALQAAQASTTAPVPVDQLFSIFAPYLTYPYDLGQPVTDGSRAGQPVGFVTLNQVVSDGMFAYMDTTNLLKTIQTIDSNLGGVGSTLLTSTFQCGTMTTDPTDTVNYVINAIPNYPFSIALEMFDDVNSVHVPGMSDDLASTMRMAFLSCFFSRQGRLPAALTNLTSSLPAWRVSLLNLPDRGAGHPSGVNNPTVEYTLGNDSQGVAMLGAMFDPDFNLALTDQSALGPHTRFGPLRVLAPAFRVLENIKVNDPSGVATNLLRYFLLLTSATVPTAQEVNGTLQPAVVTYVGPDGLTHTSAGDLLTPILPLMQPLLAAPPGASSTLTRAFDLFWDKLQMLPVDGSTVQAALLSVLAEALQRRSVATAPPLWQPELDAITAHKDALDRTTRALWPDGGAFALSGAPGGLIVAADTLVSGVNGDTGLSGTFAGPSPRPTALAELDALLGTPLEQTFQVLGDLRRVDPQSNVYAQGQRLFALGAGDALSRSGAATLRVPGILDLGHLLLAIDLLPMTVDTLELIDQAQLTPGVLAMGDAMVQAGAAIEALDLVQLTLQDTNP